MLAEKMLRMFRTNLTENKERTNMTKLLRI